MSRFIVFDSKTLAFLLKPMVNSFSTSVENQIKHSVEKCKFRIMLICFTTEL